MGILLVTIHSVSTYADGIEVQLNVGNTASASLSFAELFVKYEARGLEYATASNVIEAQLKEVGTWSSSLLTQSSILMDTLSAGRRARVKILLPAINRYGDPIADYCDWTADSEWIPLEEAIRIATVR